MSSWLLVAIASYFLSAINSITDKFLLHKGIPNPLVYAFYVGVFSIFTLVLTPFGIEWPGASQFLASLLVGAVFLVGLIFFFYALQMDETSRVVSIVGGFSPIFILVLSAILLNTRLSTHEFIAFGVLIAGGLVLSIHKNQKCGIFDFHKFECISSTILSILGALFFALFFVLAEYVFLNQPFISGFVWTRIGSFLAALLLLLLPTVRDTVFHHTKSTSKGSWALFVVNKGTAGVSFFLLNYAIAQGTSALVNALEGVKYVFIFLFALLFSKKYPQIMSEDISHGALLQKVLGITLVVTGIYILWSV